MDWLRQMTTLREARAVCERAFAFLVTDFGYKKVRSRFRWSGFEVGYRGPVMGVLVEWHPRDPLTVWLVRLVDGRFPPREMSVGIDRPLHYFDLGDVEILNVGHRVVDERELYNMPNEETAGFMAGSLREYGSGLLEGDLVLIPRLEQRIRDRARTATVARQVQHGYLEK